MPRPLLLSGCDLTRDDFYQVALENRPVKLAPSARRGMLASRALVEKLISRKQVVYAVTTGVGSLSTQRIDPAEARQLQLNLVRSHACGVGDPLSEAETRGVLLLRANVLARGLSGVRPVVVDTLCALLNCRLHPVIPAQGSVGASGDLAPLAHAALALIGEGEVFFRGRRMSARTALKRVGLKSLVLEAKEGVSLLNGTQVMLALGLLALRQAEILVDTADVAGALSLDALRGSIVPSDERLHRARPHPGAMITARHLARLTAGSTIRESHRGCARVQDAYSLRCMPQVHGTVREALGYAGRTFEIEMNSATDNPLVFVRQGEVLSGGNFHGQPLATALDLMAIVLTQLGAIAERHEIEKGCELGRARERVREIAAARQMRRQPGQPRVRAQLRVGLQRDEEALPCAVADHSVEVEDESSHGAPIVRRRAGGVSVPGQRRAVRRIRHHACHSEQVYGRIGRWS